MLQRAGLVSVEAEYELLIPVEHLLLVSVARHSTVRTIPNLMLILKREKRYSHMDKINYEITVINLAL